jgi:serine/threonine protein kinase
VLGKFRLMAELGRGGMSEVYLAVVAGPAGFNKLVVIKLIKAELAEDPDFISMFLEEARLSARLNHPNVVQTNEVGEVGSRYYIAMEYLEGQPYSRVLHRLGRDRGLPLGMSLRILSDVLQGLHYAHELADFDGSALGVVHRDVTPHNVFITYDGQIKVVDFGIAKAMNSSHETRTGMLKGKVGYMAPEQAKGERVDRRADIFSVGVMLWEAAVGRRLWKGLNEVQILHQLLAGEIPSPRSMRPDISQHLESIIMKALAVDRDRRHASAAQLQQELDELMDAGNERATLREVGRLVSQAFDEERKKLKSIIETQLAKSTMLATGMYQQVQIPMVDHPPAMTGEAPHLRVGGISSVPQVGYPMAATGSVASAASVCSYSSGNHPIPVSSSGPHSSVTPSGHPHAMDQSHMSGPRSGSLPNFYGAKMPGSYPGGDAHQSSPSVTTGSIARASVSRPGTHSMYGAPPADSANRRITLVALGVAAAAGVLAALLYLSLGRGPSGAAPAEPPKPAPTEPTAVLPTSTAPEATAASSAAAAPDEQKVALVISSKPEGADVLLDGEKIGSTPLETSIPRGAQPRELKVATAGYASKTYKVEPDQAKVEWSPVLTKERTGGQAVLPPPTGKQPPDDKKCAKTKKGRCIESNINWND